MDICIIACVDSSMIDRMETPNESLILKIKENIYIYYLYKKNSTFEIKYINILQFSKNRVNYSMDIGVLPGVEYRTYHISNISIIKFDT